MPNYAQKLSGALLAALATCLLAQTARADLVNYDMVTVGDPGNRNSIYFYGAVDTAYQIGTYEVTIAQYTAFLNTVASVDDPYGLYKSQMTSDLNSAGILRTGTTGSYVYSIMDNHGNSANRPITYVNWFDAARFANWMSNGQTSGTTATETGAYTLNGQTSGTAPTANAVNPNTGAAPTFTLPSEDQWYKAAYYNPTLNGGLGGYYQYATQVDTPAPGNLVGSGPNLANYIVDSTGFLAVTQEPDILPTENYLTDVGSYPDSASYYGTYDQNGNVWEVLDSAYDDNRALMTARGGGWTSYESYLWDSYRLSVPSVGETANGGFRLVSPIPEPSTYALLALALGLGLFLRKRLKSSAFIVTLALFATGIHRAQADSPVSYSFVTVGNAGNADDPLTGAGSVGYDYQIGQYDVTIAQYTAFLNAVASISDPNGLYNDQMATDLNTAGIVRTGTAGAYTYSVMNNGGYSGNRPVTYVSWYDSARFANWMANGQPTGTQTTTTTENGAYNLTLPSVNLGFAPPKNLVNPNTGAAPTMFLPTLDEFYKAAFYSMTGTAGSPAYFKFATQSNDNPGNSDPDDENEANLYVGTFAVTQQTSYSGTQNYLTDVGYYHNSPSYYGTYDQGGDVYQWNDLDGTLNSLRGMMGGFWFGGPTSASSTTSNSQATTYEGSDVGFRLAAPIPEPGTCALLGLAAAGFLLTRRRHA